jgi:hypothetical protein
MTALAIIRSGQGRDNEAEELFLSAIALAKESELKLFEMHPLEHLIAFLRDRGRDEDAATYEARLAELAPTTDVSTERIA